MSRSEARHPGMEAYREIYGALPPQAPELGRKPGRGKRHAPVREGQAIGIGNNADRARHRLVVGQGLPHSHEHQVRYPGRDPRSRCTLADLSTISAVSRLRFSPMLPVRQNLHPRAHPTWLKAERVARRVRDQDGFDVVYRREA